MEGKKEGTFDFLSSETTYEKWQKSEGIDNIKGYFVEDLKTIALKEWERKGGKGIFINLAEQQADDAYVCEIPPGGSLRPQRHLFEELIYIVEGKGATTIWNEGGKKQTFEWQEGSLFSPPLNTWHQHFNGQGDKPCRYLAVTSAPTIINLFHNKDFVFSNSFTFADRYNGEETYFASSGKSYPGRIWESNFIPDVKVFKLIEWKERGGGGSNILFELSHNTMVAHISEFAVGSYKKAHRHGPGAHIIILSGKGYSLIWLEGKPKVRVDWKPGSMFSPPDRWFHQHFNTSREPARYLALRWGGNRYRVGAQYKIAESTRLGGDQIEYEDEEPEVRRTFEEECKKEGITVRM